ncbi:hypothetical protein KR51_00012810 [Rubidibacter lacunae KORDI 51-2]|uniref:Uncharacterized protein n=1 Tax=Rubidibacter lacunae KORDI 51-2 TaxID=582515 RepID=U5DQI8_9CHRO|nr:hypothetical protein [Rubidibacter lacunae]ERN41955.1 hypothetical protein KR51_00012810 [Rubidibacter lacunae KORDI 51-2]
MSTPSSSGSSSKATPDSTPASQPAASAAEVAEVLAEFAQYRQRIVDETVEIAKKLKLSKKDTMARLEQHPELARIDGIVSDLQQRVSAANDSD